MKTNILKVSIIQLIFFNNKPLDAYTLEDPAGYLSNFQIELFIQSKHIFIN